MGCLVRGALEAAWATPRILGVPWSRGTSSNTRRVETQPSRPPRWGPNRWVEGSRRVADA
eukprot:6489139-Pyramimonas_sp.AAC.1